MSVFNTHFVNKYGLLFLSDVRPSRIISDSRQLLISDYQNISHNSLVYVITSCIPKFFKHIYPVLLQEKKNIFLMTGDSTLSAPFAVLNSNDYLLNKIFEQGVIKHWFAQNCDIPDHPKVSSIPLGIDFHTIYKGAGFGENITSVEKQENDLLELSQNQRNFSSWEKKDFLIFTDTHLSIHTNVEVRTHLKKYSETNELFFHLRNRIKRTEYWSLMKKFKFVACPFGKGRDTHRTWEALALGCVPIMLNDSIRNVYENLPILWIDDWSQLNTKMLSESVLPTFFDPESFRPLFLDYWSDKIKMKVQSLI